MHSAIYKGYLRHRRFHPRTHKFSYRVFMMYLDLDELDAVFKLSPLWSKNPWRPARFKRGDFLGDPNITLDHAVRQLIHTETGIWHQGPIRMLANLRYFGFNINPITCYYCFDNNQKLQTIVTEVTNTPWNERRSYVLQCDPEKRFQRIQFQKQMHVSPFNPMNMTYKWGNNYPAEFLNLHLETECENQNHVDATMVLKRVEINSRSLAGILIAYPWMTAKVAASIYWQAFKLWLKKVPLHHHPKYLEDDSSIKPTNHLKPRL